MNGKPICEYKFKDLHDGLDDIVHFLALVSLGSHIK